MKTWTAHEIIEQLAKLPPNTPVYLEDADTNWTIHLFEIRTGHTKHNGVISPLGILISPSSYADIDSSLEFEIDR